MNSFYFKNLQIQLKSIQNEANQFLPSLESLHEDNAKKKETIEIEIKKRTMQLFNFLFANQLKLYTKNKQIESSLNSAASELKIQNQNLIEKLADIQKKLLNNNLNESQIESILNETEDIRSALTQLKREAKHIHSNHYFQPNQTVEESLFIGSIITVCIPTNSSCSYY